MPGVVPSVKEESQRQHSSVVEEPGQTCFVLGQGPVHSDTKESRRFLTVALFIHPIIIAEYR